MEEGLNNANNPFGVANGATTDNIITQKTDGLMLNLSDKFKQNGTDLASPVDLFEKSNGKRPASEFDDDDFGPETNVDTVDDILSPGAKEGVSKSFADGFPSPNNNPLLEEGVFNPFMEHQEKAALEMEKNMRKRETRDEFDDEDRAAREETPTPPADAAHDVSGLVENQADSESEDEWNYIKGEEANKEILSPQPEKEVADIPEEDDTMSQLNPNAAEFVPVSPTRSIPSPVCRMLINDPIISQSPNKAKEIDINLPNPKEFENEVKLKPSEIDSCNNGLNENDDHNTSKELMENILNGKNIDEIPEFQPGSTPKKVFQNEGFHFGPNAASFTTPKILDQSEALSTQAVFGDDTTATLDHSFNDSAILNKESDPMSMSFYAENPFDLNKVQQLPNNLDDFLNEPDDSMKDSTPDLEEYLALGDQNKSSKINNDDAIQVTDLDKHSFDDEEKELASPLEQDKELLSNEEIEATKTPEPTHENLLDGVIGLPEKRIEDDFELIPEDASEVTDLLKTGTETLPKDVELIPSDLLSSERSIVTDSLINVLNLPPEPKIVETETPICDITYKTDLPLPQPRPICRLPVELYQNQEERTSPVNDAEKPDLIEEFQPHTILPGGCYVRTESKSSTCDLSESKSPMPEEPMSAGSEDFTRPEFLQQAQDNFDELCKPLESPQEDVTSSVKDDLSENTDSFIAKSPYEDKVINETLDERVSKDGESYVLEKEFAQDSLIEAIPPNDSHREELILADDISADPEQVVKICMFPPERLGPSKDVEEFIPSAVTTENASPDLIEPIAAGEEPSLNLFTAKPIICICPCPPKRIPYIKPDENIPFVVETENIAPEFAEPAVVTPSEESKTEDVVEPQQKEGLPLEVTAIGAALAVATVAPLLTDLKAEEEKKPADKKKSLSAKKTPSKTTPVKNLTATTAKSLASPVTSKMSTPTPKSAAKTSPKVPAPKIGSAKPTSPTAAPKPSPRASLSRPTPTTKAPTAKPQPIPKTQPASKPTATKLTNGETKFNKPLTARKVLSEPTSKLITKSSASATSKPTSKVPKTNAAVKTAAPPTQTRPPTAPSRISSAAKKPATLTKMTNETTDQKDGAAKVPSTKPLASKVFPKPRLAPSSAPPKPKTLTMKTETKVQPDSQKQIKDSANKITAARNVTQRKVPASANTSTANTRTTTASARTITSARRVESKVSSARTTVTKSTTSTTKAPTGKKKSTETVNATLTKTTKIEKPKENGLPTVVTEEIRIVSNASRELNNSKNIADNEQPLLINVDKQEIDVSNKVDETSPDLIKDNSPVDNKIIETQQLIHANAD